MTDKNSNLDPRIESRLEELKPVTPRNPRRAAQTRAKFMALVAAAQPAPKSSIFKVPVRVFAPALLILLLLFGTTGTVLAASDSLPGEALYPVKIFSEEVRLSWTTDKEGKVNLLLEYSATRVDEITSLALANQEVPQTVIVQLEEQYALTSQLAAGLDDNQLIATMAQVQNRLQIEEQQLIQVQEQIRTESGAQVLSQVREQVQIQLALAKMGQTDPQRFRHTVMNRNGQPTASASPTPTLPNPSMTPPPPGKYGTPTPHPTQSPGNGNNNGNDNGNGNNNGNGNQNDNGNGNGNDNGPGGSATPQGPGSGGPNPSATPAPKTPQGPGGSGAKKTPTDSGSGGGGGGGKP